MTTRERNKIKTMSWWVTGTGLGKPADKELGRTSPILSEVDGISESDAVCPNFKLGDRSWRVVGMGLGYVNDPRRSEFSMGRLEMHLMLI